MNRRLPLMVVCLSLATLIETAPAQHRNFSKVPCPTCEAVPQPSCEAPRPTCAAPEPNCKPPCKPPCQPPPQQMLMQPQGVFVQPPPSGTVQGPVEQTNIEGASITFPELNLRMPSLRMPTVSRSRQNPRMITDQQIAPFQEFPQAPVMAGPAAPAAMAPQSVAAAPQAIAAAPQMMMAQPQMMMAQPQMMMVMPQQQQYYMQPNIQSPPANITQPMQPPQPPVEEPPALRQPPQPCVPTPSCDARGVPMAAYSAEDRIRQLELVERQLQQRMEVLRRQLEQMETSQRPPVPAPDLGARAIPLPANHTLRPTGIQPVSQPVQQPGQPVMQPGYSQQQPVQAASRIYTERPAAFIGEPPYSQPQPVYSQQTPSSQVIREPVAPTAAITGFRSR
jgi:hypothetical protein